MTFRPIITLLTDFGLRDSYVAEMKAVILSICPEVNIIDISHEVRKYDVRMGAYLLARASRYFPKGTIHVAIVDPGVGSERRAIIVESERAFYIGPDNGILIMAAEMDGIKNVYQITNKKYMLQTISRTFHGRDIFSPTAAHLARGVPPSEFGPEIKDPIKPSYTKPKTTNKTIEGEVIHIDDFGNIITNITTKNLQEIGITEGETINVKIGEKTMKLKLCKSYAEVPQNQPLTIIGSGETLEISINQGNAANMLQVNIGGKIIVWKTSK
jgi:S-adenosylmethionine hydrolase